MGGRNFIQSLFLLLLILLLSISSYIYFPSIDRKVIFLFCNLILFVVIKQNIVEDEEPTKIDAAFDRGNEKKSHVAVPVELVEVENEEEEGKKRVEIDVKEFGKRRNVRSQRSRQSVPRSIRRRLIMITVEPNREGSEFFRLQRFTPYRPRVLISRAQFDKPSSTYHHSCPRRQKKNGAKVEERDELQEKIEAFIEKVKSQRRMEDLQLATVTREMTKS